MSELRKPHKITRVTIKWLEKQYADANKAYFYGALPTFVKFAIREKMSSLGETSRYTDTNGVLLYHSIEISRLVTNCGKRMTMIILLHEMNHLLVGVDANHGKKWQEARVRLMHTGAYDDVL